MNDDILELATRAAVANLRQTADDLEALRTRLGKDGTSMDEWNALTSAMCQLRVEASMRESEIAGT